MAAGRGLQASRYAPTSSPTQQVPQPGASWPKNTSNKTDAKSPLSENGPTKSISQKGPHPALPTPASSPPSVGLRTSSANMPPAVNPISNSTCVGSSVVKNDATPSMHSRKENELPIDMLAQTLRSTSLGSAANSVPPVNNNHNVAKTTSAATSSAVPGTSQTGDANATKAPAYIEPPKAMAAPLLAKDLPNNIQDLEKGRAAFMSLAGEYQSYFVSLNKCRDGVMQLNSEKLAKCQADVKAEDERLNECQKRKAALDGYIATAKNDVCAAEKVIAQQQALVKVAQGVITQYHDDLKSLTTDTEAATLRRCQHAECLKEAQEKKAEAEAKGLQLEKKENDVAMILKQNLTLYNDKLAEVKKLEAVIAANRAARLQEEKQRSEDEVTKLQLAAAQQLSQASIIRNNDIEKREAEQGSMAMFHKSPATANPNKPVDRDAPVIPTVSTGRTAVNNVASAFTSNGRNRNVVSATPTLSNTPTDDVDSTEELEEVGDEPDLVPPRARAVLLSNIPLDATIKNVFNIIFCGAVQSFSWGPQSSTAKTAHVLFLAHEGCMDYLNAAQPGIAWPTQLDRMIDVTLHEFPEVITDHTAALIQQGVTRCVRAGGSETPPTGDDPSGSALTMVGMGVDHGGRLMQGVTRSRELVDLLRGRSRLYPTLLVWRFSNIYDATDMLQWLKENWGAFDIKYHSDPCAKPANDRTLGINGTTLGVGGN